MTFSFIYTKMNPFTTVESKITNASGFLRRPTGRRKSLLLTDDMSLAGKGSETMEQLRERKKIKKFNS